MGETYAEIVLKANGKEIKKTLLVDTGATYSWINARVLKTLGIKTIRRRNFETIEGRLIKRGIGEVKIECLDEEAHTIVVFSGRKESEVLGLHALEGLGLEVDPINREVRKSKAIKAL